MTDRLTFLSHFCIMLAIAAGGYFAYRAGIPQMVAANDLSRMTSVLAALLLITAIYLGWKGWSGPMTYCRYGHLAARLSVMIGMLGTTVGLSLQAKTLVSSGTAGLLPLSTSLFTTGSGILAAILIEIMVFNIETIREDR